MFNMIMPTRKLLLKVSLTIGSFLIMNRSFRTMETATTEHLSQRASLPPHHKADLESFTADNLHESSRVSCGYYKCFFRLKDASQMGYLVTPADGNRIRKRMGTAAQWFKILQGSWHYAEYLRHKYNIQHFLLEPPTNTTVSPNLYRILNHNLWGVAQGHGAIQERYTRNSTIYIQKCKAAPTPNLFVASWGNKNGPFFANIGSFLAKHVPDKREFKRNFAKSLEKALHLLKHEPCISYDFQAMLDVHGNLCYMDFERCLQPTANEEVDYTIRFLKKVQVTVTEAFASLNARSVKKSQD